MAKALNLSVYDACYVVIAESLATNLVTAVVKLYERYKESTLPFLLKDLDETWKAS
jgi:predicted nucleic acid-binding protein